MVKMKHFCFFIAHRGNKYIVLSFWFYTDIFKSLKMSDDYKSTKKRTLSPKDDQSSQKFLRSSLQKFNENKLCFICDKKKNKGCKKMSLVSGVETIKSLLEMAKSSKNLDMQRRLENVINLGESAMVFYHKNCYAKSLQVAPMVDTVVESDIVEQHEIHMEAYNSITVNVESPVESDFNKVVAGECSNYVSNSIGKCSHEEASKLTLDYYQSVFGRRHYRSTRNMRNLS